MIVRKLEEVTNALLHDAILIATLQGNNFNRVYIDNEGGCNIKFSNKMSIDNIKLFLDSLNPKEDKSLEDIDVQYFQDVEDGSFFSNSKMEMLQVHRVNSTIE